MITCPTGKIRYPSPRLVRVGNAHQGKRIRAYRCQHCDGWHATHTQAEGRSRKPKGSPA